MLRNTITKTINKKISLLLAGMLSIPTIATAADSSSIKTINYANNLVMDEATKSTQLEQSESIQIPAIIKQGYRKETSNSEITSTEKSILITSHKHTDNFSIYNVHSDLISDFDYDGFYHRFSITIDADTYYNVAYVYAKIYLSYEGGPWNYMSSTDAYHIYGNSADDAFTIETELSEGFYAGYYDVRIELYDADNDEWLLSYGPYESNAISALPLEDSYNDDFYDNYKETITHSLTTDVYVTGHGSMGGWLLIALSIMMIARKFSIKK